MTEQTNLIELRALKVLETYDGANNYILRLQSQKKQNPKFYPTRAQSEYIINFKDTKPKVGKRWVDIDPYFAKKIADGKTEVFSKHICIAASTLLVGGNMFNATLYIYM